MKKIMFYSLILLSLLNLSCKETTEDAERRFLYEKVELSKVGANYDWVIILPGGGCHGCIQEGEYFMKNNAGNKRILFLLTNLNSIKILQQKTELRFSDHANILVDRSNEFDIPTDNAIYPCVIEMKEGKIVKYEFQSPETAAFHNLKKHLAKGK